MWDPASGQNPKTVPDEKRVKMLHKGEGVRVGRFGNEGTGGQSFLDFDWKPDTWYTMKLVVDPGKAKGTVDVRGKIWERGKEEPAAWTIEFTDPLPNFEGNYPVIGSWMVNGWACGIGIREDVSPVTQAATD